MEEKLIVRELLNEVLRKNLEFPLKPLKPKEAKLLSNSILEKTGSSISDRSLRNFVKNAIVDSKDGRLPSEDSLGILFRHIQEDSISRNNEEKLINYQAWINYKKKFKEKRPIFAIFPNSSC
ncbi:MAG: hypothetical protein KDD99_08645 [Bacteroidetes bacterium]|nr:hypothetical protein [Bacteroidota bacterium]